MATRQRKAGSSGRVTPKSGSQQPPTAKGTAPSAKTPDPKPVSIGRRPSSTGFLTVVAVMWMAVGVILFLTLSSNWKLIPSIVAFGIGVLFLRGAVSTVLRRERRRSSEG